jgi:hypothetical protein
MRNLQVNGERLWANLMELVQIGAAAKEGYTGLPRATSTARRASEPRC